MSVFVLGSDRRPLMPCSERRARLLLTRKRAAVFRRYPFTIILKDRTQHDCELQPIEVRIDPGSRVTGMAVVRKGDGNKPDAVLHLAELTHRGHRISEALKARAAFRRRRRGKRLRYRPARFSNRTKPKGWLAPSLRHRVETTMSWVNRYRRYTPVVGLVMELVRFDLQKHENPEISGAEYQQGEMAGYEVREYLLEKYDRCCSYCGVVDVPLNIDHIHPRSRGGSNRISNLTLACIPCNQKKGAKPVEEFLVKQPKVLARVLAKAKTPLKDAAAVNSTRWALFMALKVTGLPVTTGSGGRTKWNRSRLGIPKSHALDSVCVGQIKSVSGWQVPVLGIKAMGRGAYQRTRLDKFGFPRGYFMREKSVCGFTTGDMVRAVVPKGKNAGTHVGRVAIRATGSFNIQTSTGVVQGIGHRHCRAIARSDGYAFTQSRPPIGLSLGELLYLPKPKGRSISENFQ
jgi:5-methylcytosine-specific restriction endonuclease McrA